MPAKNYRMTHMMMRWNVTVYSVDQQESLGHVLAKAVTENRGIEVRQLDSSIIVLVSPADDLGHVYRLTSSGGVKDIGTTLAP
jgi:hypothetical protein